MSWNFFEVAHEKKLWDRISGCCITHEVDEMKKGLVIKKETSATKFLGLMKK